MFPAGVSDVRGTLLGPCSQGILLFGGRNSGVPDFRKPPRQDVLRKSADEYYVFVVSDADLARYGISPATWNKILMQEQSGFNREPLLYTCGLESTTCPLVVCDILVPSTALTCIKTKRVVCTAPLKPNTLHLGVGF